MNCAICWTSVAICGESQPSSAASLTCTPSVTALTAGSAWAPPPRAKAATSPRFQLLISPVVRWRKLVPSTSRTVCSSSAPG